MNTHILKSQWEVRPYLTPDLEDDPMGVYRVAPVSDLLTEAYLAAEPDTPELEAVHTENRKVAALIAAAPDLLEALYCLRARGLDELSKRMADVAIAKAEGKVAP